MRELNKAEEFFSLSYKSLTKGCLQFSFQTAAEGDFSRVGLIASRTDNGRKERLTAGLA